MATTAGGGRGDAGDSSPALAWVVPVLAFLAGCLLSGIAVALVMSNTDDEVPVTAAPTVEPSLAPDSAEAPPPEVVVRVPESCLDAADGALEVGREAEQLVAAVRDLDARRLQEIVERFQRNQPGLQQLARRCQDATDQRIEDGATDPPTPTSTG